MHRRQAIETWQYMYVTESGKCVPVNIFYSLIWAAQFVNATTPDPIEGVWRQATVRDKTP